jgi:hypothetical protein
VELQTGVAQLSSSAGATDTIFAAFDERLDDLTTQVKSLADVVEKSVIPIETSAGRGYPHLADTHSEGGRSEGVRHSWPIGSAYENPPRSW